MISAIIGSVPAYQRFPRQLIGTDLTQNGEINLRLFLRTMRQDRELRPDELEDLIVAIQRAKEGVPLEDVLRVYHVGALAAWNMVVSSVEGQRKELLAAVPHLLRYLGAVLPGVAAAYVREGQDLYWERREARRSLAEALLAGEASTAAARFDLPVAERYAVVVLRIAQPAERRGQAGHGRPSMRTVQAEIDRLPGALATMDRTDGDGVRHGLPARATRRPFAAGEALVIETCGGGGLLPALYIHGDHAEVIHRRA